MAYGSDNSEGSYGDCDDTTLEGPNYTDLSCDKNTKIIYEDECVTPSDALACYEDLNNFRGDASLTNKFTRDSTVEDSDDPAT